MQRFESTEGAPGSARFQRSWWVDILNEMLLQTIVLVSDSVGQSHKSCSMDGAYGFDDDGHASCSHDAGLEIGYKG